jgi:hypothetical protein
VSRVPKKAVQQKAAEPDPLVHPTPWGNLLRWELPKLMAANGFRFATQLHAALKDQGVDLSYSHVHRLTQQAPERLTVDVQFALCRIFNCDPAELWSDAGAVPAERPAELDARKKLKDLKPVRPRIRKSGT